MDAEKEREEALIQHNVLKDGNHNGMQSKRQTSSRHINLKRIVQGIVR